MATTITLPGGLYFTIYSGPAGTGLIGEITVPDGLRQSMGHTTDFCVVRFAPGVEATRASLLREATEWLQRLTEAVAKEADRAEADEEQERKTADVADHAYLSAGDNPYASGDVAYTGCSLCGRPRRQHPVIQ